MGKGGLVRRFSRAVIRRRNQDFMIGGMPWPPVRVVSDSRAEARRMATGWPLGGEPESVEFMV